MSDWRNGTGRGITFVNTPTAPIVVGECVTNGFNAPADTARGFTSTSDGTVEITLPHCGDVTVTTTAGVKEFYDILEIKDGGTIALTNITLFW
jgi:hypothetical protein